MSSGLPNISQEPARLMGMAFAVLGFLFEVGQVTPLMGQGDEVGEDADANEDVVQGFDAACVDVLAFVLQKEISHRHLRLISAQQRLYVMRHILHLHSPQSVQKLHRHLSLSL
eukprot:c14651_g2_i1 orf=3-338(-)